jgi:hypothetical protein
VDIAGESDLPDGAGTGNEPTGFVAAYGSSLLGYRIEQSGNTKADVSVTPKNAPSNAREGGKNENS